MAKDGESKTGVIIVIVILVLLVIVVGIFLMMYTIKLNNYQANQPYCPPLACKDGSTPFANMTWYDAENGDEDDAE